MPQFLLFIFAMNILQSFDFDRKDSIKYYCSITEICYSTALAESQLEGY